MKVFVSKNKLILSFIACLAIIDLFDHKILMLFGKQKNMAMWEVITETGTSIIEIILVFWSFQIGKKIIYKSNEKEKRYRRLVELSPEAIIVHREEKIIYINQAGANLLGANSHAEVLNYYWKEIIHPDSYDRFQSLEEDSLLNHSFKATRLDGTVFDLEIISTNIEYGGQPAREVIARDVTSRKRKEAIVKQLAYHDDLTGLPNRRSFIDTLNQMVVHTEKHNSMFAVMFIDLDGFKQINDSLGHKSGDDILKQVSNHLKRCVREKDMVARLGGDEFTILLPDATQNECTLVAKRIIERFDSHCFTSSEDVKVTPSIGIALYPQNGDDAEMLIKQADYAMYQAKRQGKNCYYFAKVSELSIK